MLDWKGKGETFCPMPNPPSHPTLQILPCLLSLTPHHTYTQVKPSYLCPSTPVLLGTLMTNQQLTCHAPG